MENKIVIIIEVDNFEPNRFDLNGKPYDAEMFVSYLNEFYHRQVRDLLSPETSKEFNIKVDTNISKNERNKLFKR